MCLHDTFPVHNLNQTCGGESGKGRGAFAIYQASSWKFTVITLTVFKSQWLTGAVIHFNAFR